MEKLIAFFTEYLPLIRAVFTAVAGLLLMLAGLGVFRRFFSPLCAILGLAVGMELHAAFPRDEMYLVAAMICIACGVIGYENYRCALVLTSFLSVFLAGGLFVLRRAYEDVTLAIGEAGCALETDKGSIIRLWFYRFKYEGDMKEAMSRVFRSENPITLNQLSKPFGDVLDALQIGFGVALIIGFFAGALSILLADYVVIAATVALGSVMLTGLIDETEFLKQIQYNYKLMIFFAGAAVFQFARYYKSIEDMRQKKKRRGLYEKKR